MPAILNRLSIGKKIIGLVGGLLSIMLVIAAYSEYLSMKRVEAAEDLAQWLIPAQVALDKINKLLVEQQLHEERLVRLANEPATDQAEMATELDSYRQVSDKLNTQIRELEEGVGVTLQRVHTVDDAVALTRIDALIPGVEADHKGYEALFLRTLESLRKKEALPAIPVKELLKSDRHSVSSALQIMQATFTRFIDAQTALVREQERQRNALGRQSLFATLAAFVLGILLASWITRRMLQPIRRLIESTRAVSKGDYSVIVEPTTGDEIGALTLAFRDLTQELREKDAIRQTFSQYVDPRIVRHLLAPGTSDMEGDRREMTVFFSDIREFTSISERLTPQSLVRLVNAYLCEMSKPIAADGGVIDKFIGDAIMAYWGPPFVEEDEHPRLAVQAALQSLECLDTFRRQIPEITGLRSGAPDIDIRIGIATGPVLIGNMGSPTMKNYTIMGDTVNLAARMETACKEYGVRLLISDSTLQRMGEAFLVREIDLIAVKGKLESTRIYQPLALKGRRHPELEEIVNRYALGLAAYRDQQWDEACAAFNAVLAIDPQDGPARVLAERVAWLRIHAPGADWDGVWRLASK